MDAALDALRRLVRPPFGLPDSEGLPDFEELPDFEGLAASSPSPSGFSETVEWEKCRN
jgi:hypothetical protein